jgi:hypothetical protein
MYLRNFLVHMDQFFIIFQFIKIYLKLNFVNFKYKINIIFIFITIYSLFLIISLNLYSSIYFIEFFF